MEYDRETYSKLQAIEAGIRVHSQRAESRRESAAHFIEVAEIEEAEVAQLEQRKAELLGTEAVSNVIVFPGFNRR